MNIALRKLAMLEKELNEQAEQALIEGYCSRPIDQDFKNRVNYLMDKVRAL
jgi:hypothetical protein